MISETDLARARELIRQSSRILVFTGAGISADSGVPTFRGMGGDSFWGKYDPMQLASPEGFRADPQRVYDWYTWRRTQLANIKPNAGHQAIAQLQARRKATVVTQNADGLHERVAPEGAVIHRLHGTLAQDRCNGCERTEDVDLLHPPALRCCPACGAYMRPAVVWFGETLDPEVWEASEQAAQSCDLMLVVGTSGAVYPAAALVQRAARGAEVIVVNPEATPLEEVASVVLPGGAAQILPGLID